MAYTYSEEYSAIGQHVIETVEELKYLQNADCRIGFMASDKRKTSNGNAVYGECIKTQDLYKEFCPYDFLIVFYEPNLEGWSDYLLGILAEHELLHVGVEEKEGGEMRYFIRPHDYADFRQITNKYGADWSSTDYQ